MSNGFVNSGQVALQTAQGLQGMRNQRQQYDIREDQRQFQQEDRAAQQQQGMQRAQALQEGAQLLQAEDSLAVAQWAIKNPELRENFTSAINLQDTFAARPRISTAKDILSGRLEPRAGYQARIDEIESKGGDASKLKEAVNTKSDDELRQIAEKDVAMLDPKAYESYAKTLGGQGTDKGFTLSEGQTRFKEGGEVVASVAKTVNQLDRDLKTSKSQFDKASKIRGEVEKVTKVFRDVEDSYGRIKAATTGKADGATDMALIFNYMKMLDPGSTVREGEFATAAETGGLHDKIWNLYNKAKDGQMLTPSQRKNFVKQAKSQFDTAERKNTKRMKDYERLGKRYGLARGDVIIAEEVQEVSDQDLFNKYGI